MKLTLKNTPEQIELVKAMGSKNATAAREASEAFAAFLGPVIQQVLMTAGTASAIYTDAEFNEDDNPSYPLDLYYNENEGYITVWSQHLAGGLPTSQVEGVAEMKIATYRLDSAVSWLKRYARRSRLDVISKAIERMANEMLIKQERNAWAVILRALAEANTSTQHGGATGGPASHEHILATNTAGVFELNDLSNLMTRLKRINESYSGHTPVSVYSQGLTDLYLSPELKAQIRAFAWNPLNTSGADNATANARNQTLPDNVREEIYRNAGMQSIFGVNITEMIELGNRQKYNTLFGSFADANTPGHGNALEGATAGNVWSTHADISDELIIGLDNSRGAFIRPVAREAESGGTFTALPDEQFNAYGTRVEKVGFYGFLEEGRVCLDARAIAGLVV
jgi:hypothetical protein